MGVERLPEGISARPAGSLSLAGFPGEVEVLELTGVPTPAAFNDTGELWSRSPVP
jgi:adenylate cyclase